MSELKCSVVPLGEENTAYGCGHTGPSQYDFKLGERQLKIHHDRVDPKQCGQCHLDEIKKLIVACTKCTTPILPGDSCVMSPEGSIFCGSVDCGPNPIGMNPGKWNGEWFDSDFAHQKPRC